jgi:hypothetical protein
MGSVPDGWWRDRRGAASRLVARMADLAAQGIPASALGLPEQTWYPEWTAVVEGQARQVEGAPGVGVVRADASGDDAIVVAAQQGAAAGRRVTVVTSDRGLSDRVTHAGAAVRGARWLLDLLAG